MTGKNEKDLAAQIQSLDAALAETAPDDDAGTIRLDRIEAQMAAPTEPGLDRVTAALAQLDARQQQEEPAIAAKHLDLGAIERQVAEEMPGLVTKDGPLDAYLQQLGAEAANESAQGPYRALLMVAQSLNTRQKQTLSQLNTLLWTVRPFRWIGWLFLVLATMDLAGMVVDLELMNPQSELNLIQGFIDRIPVPLLGIALVFWGGAFRRTRTELFALKGLTWGSFGLGVLLLLLAPLALMDGRRLDSQNVQRLHAAQQQLTENSARIDQRLNAAATPAEMQALLRQISGKPIVLAPDTSLEAVQKQLGQAEATQRQQIEHALTTGRIKHWMSTTKWAVGALLSGLIFIAVWRMTRWVRLA